VTTYLCVRPTDNGDWTVFTSPDPTPCLGSEGLASAIFGAFEAPAPAVPADGVIALLFADSPRQLLNDAMVNLPAHAKSSMFVTHGLACAGIVSASIEDAEATIDLLGESVSGWELWPIAGGVLAPDNMVHRPPPQRAYEPLATIDETDLPFESVAQVRQLNANLQMLAAKASRYAPELLPTLHKVSSLGTETAGAIRSLIATDGDDLSLVQLRHDSTALLVELNAGVTMLYSQLLTGGTPLVRESYPVAEYSLLGIGTASRALMGLYRHLNGVFGSSNYLARIEAAYETGEAFPAWVSRLNLDYGVWEASSLRLANLPAAADAPENHREHILYFSSRYGFHETLNTMSASWQCVHASATRAWNLLTLSHEFVHAHIREIVDVTLERFTYAELASIMNDDDPGSPWESLATAFMSSMLFADRVRRDLPQISAANPSYRSPGWKRTADASVAEYLIEGRSRRVLQELIVHSLDLLYVYDGRADLYLASIWGSWSYVQSILKRLHHYCLRSLVALAAADAEHTDEQTAYASAESRLKEVFERLADEPHGDVARRALQYMTTDPGKYRLQAEFQQAYYVARLTRTMLFDNTISHGLRLDETTEVVDGVARYTFEPGQYPSEAVQSPTEFLLDRFSSYGPDRNSDEIEFESVWQLLLLVDSGHPGET
jgi:hypothetical protein